MGSGLLSSPEDKEQGLRYSEVFEAYCPYYLSIGMSYELYWQGDAAAVRHFRKADIYRQKRRNTELWLQGLYVYEAIGDLSPILRPFAKAGTKPREYPAEPYPLDREDRDRKAERERAEEAERTRAMLEAWAAKVNKQFLEKKEVGSHAERTDGTD